MATEQDRIAFESTTDGVSVLCGERAMRTMLRLSIITRDCTGS
jgi:hypothetical protein